MESIEIILKITLMSCVFMFYFAIYNLLKLEVFTTTNLDRKGAGIVSFVITIAIICLSIFLAFKL